MKRLAVFCGANSGADAAYTGSAKAFGALLAGRGIGVVYGGGRTGMMGTLADAALAAGGEVIGVIPKALETKELAHRGVTRLHIVPSMHERKALMADLADGFIALPGGIGTLEELFEIWTWGQLGFHQKPCGLLNVGGYFDHLQQFLGRMVSHEFLRSEHLQMLMVATNGEELLEHFGKYQPPRQAKWINRDES